MTQGVFPKADGDIFYGAEAGLIGNPYPYGDGSDGAATLTTASWTIPYVKNYTTLTINAGQTLTVTSGTIICCTGTLTLNGVITVTPSNTGGTGGNGAGCPAGGNGGAGGGCLWIFAHDVTGSGTVNVNGAIGSVGGNGSGSTTATSGASSAGSGGSTGILFGNYVIASAGAGSRGYDGGSGGSSASVTHIGLVRTYFGVKNYIHYMGGSGGGGGSGEHDSGGGYHGGGGAGGSGGGFGNAGGNGGGGVRCGGAGDGAGGGGGGGAGGFMAFVTHDNNGTVAINAIGGAGGNTGSGGTVNGGGGGGGSGGIIITLADNTNFVCDVSGGALGTGVHNGVAGGAGLALEKTL
jgi:hypothetical protein